MVNKRITAAKRVDSQEPVIVACSVGHVHQPPQCHYKQHLCHVHALAQCRAREAVCILCKYTYDGSYLCLYSLLLLDIVASSSTVHYERRWSVRWYWSILTDTNWKKELCTQLLKRKGGALVKKCAEAVGIAHTRWNWVSINHSYWFGDAQ